MEAGRGRYARGAAYCVHFCSRRKNSPAESEADDTGYTPRLYDAGWIDFSQAQPSSPLCAGCRHDAPALGHPMARAFHELFKRCEDDVVMGFSGVSGYDWRQVYADLGLLGVPRHALILAKEYFRMADSYRQQHARALSKALTLDDKKGGDSRGR